MCIAVIIFTGQSVFVRFITIASDALAFSQCEIKRDECKSLYQTNSRKVRNSETQVSQSKHYFRYNRT